MGRDKMSMMDRMKSVIRADNDQELEAAREWVRTETPENLLRVWFTIQKVHADPLIERMSLLAQLKLGELVAEMKSTDTPANG